MTSEKYFNPVEIIHSNDWVKSCRLQQDKLNIQRPLIITTQGTLNRLGVAAIFPESVIFSGVKPNPTLVSCQDAIDYCLKHNSFDGIVALGGGSAMDTAKCVMAAFATGKHHLAELLNTDCPYKNHLSSIFIPTTHGTASEVTMWGTVWDMESKVKYSLSHTALYPTTAILDPNLTLSLPLNISLTTTLDALSHSFEAIWNKKRNATSTSFAIQAIVSILGSVSQLKEKPDNLEMRSNLLTASTTAGLAFSQTRTAAAHSISYPLTMYYSIPHGIAASISIIPLLTINGPLIQDALELLYRQSRLKGMTELQSKIRDIPASVLKYRLRDWGIPFDQLNSLATQCFTTGRMENNIVDLSVNQIQDILEEIY
jgi:alcohol dehydrogenase class IV